MKVTELKVVKLMGIKSFDCFYSELKYLLTIQQYVFLFSAGYFGKSGHQNRGHNRGFIGRCYEQNLQMHHSSGTIFSVF